MRYPIMAAKVIRPSQEKEADIISEETQAIMFAERTMDKDLTFITSTNS